MTTPTVPIVLVDSGADLPYKLPDAKICGLLVGDYSLEGFSDRVAITRKSKEDLYGNLGHGREIFEGEWKRLAELEYAAICVECSLPDLLSPPDDSRMSGKSAVGSILAWSVRYNLHVYFCGDPSHAQATAIKLLGFFHKYRVQGGAQ